ncbi:MAG TPA: Gfo/Idh/MocA family oxidoreductase [Polyangia bacterium]|jgi:Predicted dehydrogenases and related proteins|nr:Gfo/Idh/MocA family oxidoreductase [Polyangia bacterium]
MFRFGILSTSHFGLTRMIPAMQAGRDISVVAIASRDGNRAAHAARTLGVPKSYDSYEALLADPAVDAVYNPLPNHLHVPWSERAAAAGKHVLCEKPIALDAAQARQLVAVRDRYRVLICEAAMVRVQPRWLAVRDLLGQKTIGELRAFVGTFGYRLGSRDNVRYDPAMGGGVLLDTGFYPVTMSRFCFGNEPTAVMARAKRDPDRGVDCLTSAILEFPQGHAIFTTGMETFPVQRAQLIGTGGDMEMINPWNPPGNSLSEIVVNTSSSIEEPTPRRVSFDPVDQYTLLAEQFARAAETGGPGPVPLEDSIKNMAVLDALQRSATSGRCEPVG